MNKNLAVAITLAALFGVLALPVRLSAQQQSAVQEENRSPRGRYRLIDLGTLGGPNSSEWESPLINNQGAITGASDTADSDPNAPNCYNPDCFVNHAYIWRNGRLTDLGGLPGGFGREGTGINDDGQISGQSLNGAGIMKTASKTAAVAIANRHFMKASLMASAQDQSTTVKQANKHRYRLIDLGTFGGAAAYFGTSGDRTSQIQALNNKGEVAGWATTSAPDPYPDFCWDGDCFLAHTFQWQNGVIADLGALIDGVNSDARWIANNGLISGDSENGELDPLNPGFPEIRAALWKDGHIIDLGTLEGGYESEARAVNSKGQVVGVSLNTIPDPNSIIGSFYGILYQQGRAFLWQDGVMQDLGTLGTGTNAIALLINERGQIAGDSYTSTDPSPFCFYNYNVFPLTTGAFLWEKGRMTDLGGLGGTCTLASALNNRGQVAGWSNLAGDQAYHAFRWDPTTHPHLRDLGTLGGTTSIASAMNEAGDAVGSAFLPGDQVAHATMWGRHGITDLGAVGTDQCSEAFSINSSDQVVGISHSQCGADDANAFLWERGGPIIDLNAFVPPGSDLHLRAGATINDRGEIAAVGAFPNGDHRAVLLVRCDDEPADSEGCFGAAAY